jgi:hypothetical protein
MINLENKNTGTINKYKKTSFFMTANSAPKPTKTSQPEIIETPAPSFGWTRYAERMNGRFAMVGFVALLLTELVSKQDFFTWLNLR